MTLVEAINKATKDGWELRFFSCDNPFLTIMSKIDGRSQTYVIDPTQIARSELYLDEIMSRAVQYLCVKREASDDRREDAG